MKNFISKILLGLLLVATCAMFAQCSQPISDDSASEIENRDMVSFCSPCEIEKNSILIVEQSPIPIQLDIDNRRTILDKFPTQIAILAGENIHIFAHRQTIFHIREIEQPNYAPKEAINISYNSTPNLPNTKARIGSQEHPNNWYSNE